MAIDIVELLKCDLLDAKNNRLKVHWLWNKKPAVLIFVRHFACLACRAHVEKVWQNRHTYEDQGAQIFFIGNGDPRFIQAFKEDLGIENAAFLTDPTLKTFQACGFKKGFLASVGPRALSQGLKLIGQGYKNQPYEKAKGDLWQLGGVVAFNTQGKVIFEHISEMLGDFPPHSDVAHAVEDDPQIPAASTSVWNRETECKDIPDDWQWLHDTGEGEKLKFPS